jgi:hypothetical protein
MSVDTTETAAQGLRIESDRSLLGHGDNPAPPRKLACAKCGHGFTVTEGEQALQSKRRRQAGLTDDAEETAKTFQEKAEQLAKVWRR